MANMHLVTGHAGQNHITAADHASLNAAILGAGEYVLDRGSKLAVSIISNNSIRIADGDIMMQGRHIRLNEGSYVDLTIDNGTQDMLRNDLVVCRYTMDSQSGVEEANLVVIKGTPAASNPKDPEYTSGDIITDHAFLADMPLYRVPLNGLNIQEIVPLFELGYVHFEFKSGSVDADKLADGAVSTAKIQNNAVTTAKLAGGAVTPEKLSVAYVPIAGTTMTGALVAAPGASSAAQVRNVIFGETEVTAGETSSYPEGTMYFKLEE